MKITRREMLANLSIAGAALAFDTAVASGPTPEHDWDWLVGNWDVFHRRLKKRLAGNDEWDEFAGKSSFWHVLGGLGNVDDNLLDLPAGTYRAISLRAYDPVKRAWAIWWLDGRVAAKLDPPVIGGFHGDEGEFVGKDVFNGKPIDVRFRWHEIHGGKPHWDQAFSPNGGRRWEINWRNYFTRTSATSTPIPRGDETVPEGAEDWQFLEGRWRARNRRLTKDGRWEEFDSTLYNRPVMGGLGNVGDNVFHAPSGTYRGVSVRAFDATKREWRGWWLDGRTPADIVPIGTGTFKDGVGTLIGDGVRSQWTRTTTRTPRWEQATSSDGRTWTTNWSADFERA